MVCVNTTNRIKSLLVLVISFAVSVVFVLVLAYNQEGVSNWLLATGWLAPIIIIALYGILSATPIPTDPLSLINGAFFGPVIGAFISWLGNNLAAGVEYYLGREIAVAADFEHMRKKLPNWISRFPADSYAFLILGRLIPQFGGKIVSFSGGIYKVNIYRYMWTAAVGNLVGSVMYAIGGDKMMDWFGMLIG